MERKRKSLICYMIISLAVVLLNVIAWNSTAFCDAYIANIFPLWVNIYGRLTGLFPFSVGEIMLILGVLLVLSALFLGVAAVFIRAAELLAVQSRKKKGNPDSFQNRKSRIWRIIKGFYLFFAWTLLIVALVMTLNCFILYHASTFSEQYFGEEKGEYTLKELLYVRNYVVEQCNLLAKEMDRDENGAILYQGDMHMAAITCMQQLGQTYKQLDGYYPRPKPLYTSDFFCQQYMCGYYFPFSMEANYNDVMYIMNKPSTMCHELAHLRGYIFEDEANFISYLACVRSQDPVFVYSGYLSVLYYLDNDFYSSVGKDRDAYLAQPQIEAQVIEDNVFVTDKEWERINKKALIDTETVDQVSDVLVDATLKVNGVADGKVSYSRVVGLLLQYYRQQGMI